MSGKRGGVQNSPFSSLLTVDEILKREKYLRLFSCRTPSHGCPRSTPPTSSASPSIRYAQYNDNVKVKSRIKDICWNAGGNRLFIATRDNVVITNPYALLTETYIHTSSSRILPHPSHPDIFAVLCYVSPVIKIYDLRTPSSVCTQNSGNSCANADNAASSSSSLNAATANRDKCCLEISSEFKEPWTAGAWRRDGNVITACDRQDRLHLIELNGGGRFGEGRINFAAANYYNMNRSQAAGEAKGNEEELKGVCRSDAVSRSNKDIAYTKQCKKFYGEISSMCYDGFGELLFLAKWDGMIDVYAANDFEFREKKCVSVRAHSSVVLSCAADPTGEYLATGGGDQMVSIFDINTMSGVCSFSRLDGSISSVAFSYDGQLLAWGTKDARTTSSFSLIMNNTNTGGVMNSVYNNCGRTAQDSSDNSSNTCEHNISIAICTPCEICFQHKTPTSVLACAWHPSRYILAYACDNDNVTQQHISGATGIGGIGRHSTSSVNKLHPIFLLTIE